MSAALIALSAMGTAGCSWLFVKPLPPNYDLGDNVDCTSDATAPVVDTLFALADVAGFVYAVAKSTGQNDDQFGRLITAQVLGFAI